MESAHHGHLKDFFDTIDPNAKFDLIGSALIAGARQRFGRMRTGRTFP
jgi:hypothetical protein